MADKQLVLAIFKDEAAAEAAVGMLRGGIDDYTEIDFGAMGILVVDDKGKLKEHKLGQRSGGKGAAIGLAIAAVTPVGLAQSSAAPQLVTSASRAPASRLTIKRG